MNKREQQRLRHNRACKSRHAKKLAAKISRFRSACSPGSSFQPEVLAAEGLFQFMGANYERQSEAAATHQISVNETLTSLCKSLGVPLEIEGTGDFILHVPNISQGEATGILKLLMGAAFKKFPGSMRVSDGSLPLTAMESGIAMHKRLEQYLHEAPETEVVGLSLLGYAKSDAAATVRHYQLTKKYDKPIVDTHGETPEEE